MTFPCKQCATKMLFLRQIRVNYIIRVLAISHGRDWSHEGAFFELLLKKAILSEQSSLSCKNGAAS